MYDCLRPISSFREVGFRGRLPALAVFACGKREALGDGERTARGMRQTDRRTDRQTDTRSALYIFAIPSTQRSVFEARTLSDSA